MKFLDIITDCKYKVFNSYWWRNFYYEQISSRIRPRNKWLTKQIPRTWRDIDTILEICILGCLRSYVDPEGEDCFNVLSCDNPPEQAKFMKEVRYHYDLMVQKLVSLEKELDAEWKSVPHFDLTNLNRIVTKDDYERTYGKINRLEKEIYDLKTKIMVWVVKNRSALWT